MTSPRLTVSIAVHNALEHTQKCIDSLYQWTPEEEFALVVTDNASTDGTPAYLKILEKKHGNVVLVTNDRNLGFSEPHNRAFGGLTSEFFLVLNNDLTLCEGWLPTMMAEFERDAKLAACGIKGTCIALDDKGCGVPGHEAEYVEGSCLLVRGALVRSLDGGLFDPVFKFAYYEDSDLGLRIRRSGLRIAVVDLPIVHIGAATSRIVRNVDLDGYKIRNHHVFMGRWGTHLKDRAKKPITTDRIFVKRAGAQGDVILATPILRALRIYYPMSTIVVQTVCKDVLSGNPDVNEVGVAPARKESDYVIDLDMAYERRPMEHIVKVYADVAKVQLPTPEDWRPALYPTDTARIVALQRMPPTEKYAIIHPGAIAGWVGRQWPWKRWIRVVQMLDSYGYRTVLVGNESTPQIPASLDLRNVPFVHFVALMERASLFVGLDSMPFHVAQTYRIPSVVLFGAVDPALRIIPGAPVIPVVAEEVGCLGCHHWQPAPRTCTSVCLRGQEMCMELLSEGQVNQAIIAATKLVKATVGA